MKKIMMIAVLAVAALTANAQDHKWTITPHLGVGYTRLGGLEFGDVSFENGIGATLGVDFMYQPTKLFGISVGLDVRAAYTGSNKWDNGSEECHFEYSSFEFPILAHINLNKHWSFFAGPKINVPNELKLSISTVSLSWLDERKVSVSIPVGFTYTFNKPWVLSAYYDIPTGKVISDDGYDVKASNIMITLGYKFNI